jgi:anthranilate phosphoribosyltransferase
MDPKDFDIKDVLARAAAGKSLTAREAESAFDCLMDGSATQAQMAALLTALRVKGLEPLEVAGGVRALQKAMIPVPASDVGALVDTCGTGGGSLTTFNISTAASLVAAGAGVRIAKHGNRSFTSRSGSADVLEALGVEIQLSAERMGEVLEEAGIVFMFAPLLHPAMRHVGSVRRELGFRTVMNILGPLTNPAGVTRQLVGVADPELVDLVVHALRELGHARALVVHGEPGVDELSPVGSTRVAELRDGEVFERSVGPGDFGLPIARPEELSGGEPEENAQVILDVLEGTRTDGAYTATVLNAGAAIYLSGQVDSLGEGMTAAKEAVESRAALGALERLRTATLR